MKHLDHIHYEIVPVQDNKVEKEYEAILLQQIYDQILLRGQLFIYKFLRSQYISLSEFIRLANIGIINLHKEQMYILCEKLLDRLILFNIQKIDFSHGNLKMDKSIWLRMNKCSLSFDYQTFDYDIVFINFSAISNSFENDLQDIIGWMSYMLDDAVFEKLVTLKNIQEQQKFIQSHIVNLDQMTQQLKVGYTIIEKILPQTLGPFRPMKQYLNSQTIEEVLINIAKFQIKKEIDTLFSIDLIDAANLSKDYVYDRMLDYFYKQSKREQIQNVMELCRHQFHTTELILNQFQLLNTTFHTQWQEVMNNQECISIVLRKPVRLNQSEHEQINSFFEYLIRHLVQENYFSNLTKFTTTFDPEELVKEFFKTPIVIEQIKVDIREAINREFDLFLQKLDQSKEQNNNLPPQEP